MLRRQLFTMFTVLGLSAVTKAAEKKKCPVCEEDLYTKGSLIYCNNEECIPKVKMKVKRWIKTVGINGWDDILVNRLVEEKVIKDIADLYSLDKAVLKSKGKIREKTARKLIRKLQLKKEVSFEDFFYGLGMRDVTRNSIKIVFESGVDTAEKLMKASYNDLLKLNGVSVIEAKALYDGSENYVELIDELLNFHGIKIRSNTGMLDGKSFCFASIMNNKKETLEKLVTNNGGVLENSIKDGISYIVLSDGDMETKFKNKEALGTKRISEDEFLDLIGI